MMRTLICAFLMMMTQCYAGWYMTASGGVNYLDAEEAIDEPGEYVSLAAGYRLAKWRLEAEGCARSNAINLRGQSEDHKLDVSTDQGDFYSLSGFINASRDFFSWPITPYVGAGAGYIYTKADGMISATYTEYPNQQLLIHDGSKEEASPAGQAFGGIRLNLGSKYSLLGEYRYMVPLEIEGRNQTFCCGLNLAF